MNHTTDFRSGALASANGPAANGAMQLHFSKTEACAFIVGQTQSNHITYQSCQRDAFRQYEQFRQANS